MNHCVGVTEWRADYLKLTYEALVKTVLVYFKLLIHTADNGVY